MSDAKKSAPAPEAADAAPKPKKNTLLYVVIIVLILVILVGGALALYLIFSLSNTQNYSEAQQAATEHQAESEDEDKGHKKKKKEKKKGEHGDVPLFMKLDTFTVNLQGGNSVLQTEVNVQVADEKQQEVIKAYIPRLSSQILLILGSKKPEELTTVESRLKLMEEVKTTVNRVLGAKDEEDGVMSVEFKTFIIQ
ncbi:flagellar basal body-associated FliL family protein [Burkholderiaceae bacterium DAT-1]|nr:flagellar basal body-associated FliL family protein [Burkholderiaceae bacterium DAT-1]